MDFMHGLKGKAKGVLHAAGNHPLMLVLWIVVGLICAAISPWFMIKENSAKKFYVRSSIYGVVVAGFFYGLGLTLKNTPVLRVRGNWRVDLYCNWFVTLVGLVVTLLHKVSERDVAAQILVSISVFCLMEISRPTYDYGILQMFLRLPIQSASVCCLYNGEGCVIGWRVGLLSFVSYICFSAWNAFYLSCFQEDLRRKKEDEERRTKEAEEEEEEVKKEDEERRMKEAEEEEEEVTTDSHVIEIPISMVVSPVELLPEFPTDE